MPYRDRFVQNCYYHIYNRWLHKQKLFHTENDLKRFMKYVKYYKKKCLKYFDILAYCILPNHFHFIFHVKISWYKVSYFIGRVCSAYTKYYMIKYDIDKGMTYFEGRFMSKEITDSDYLWQCISYVYENAVHHELVENASNWRFCSVKNLYLTSPGTGMIDQLSNLESHLE